VLASAFGVLLALPIVAVMVTPVTIDVPLAATHGLGVPSFDSSLLSSPGEIVSAPYGPASGETGWSLRSLAAMPASAMLFCAWFVGAVLFVIPVITALLQIRSLRRSGLHWGHGQVIAEKLAARVRRSVEVLLHASLSTPMTCGVLRPVIILPEDVRSSGPRTRARAAL
jgi:hypothetical protein